MQKKRRFVMGVSRMFLLWLLGVPVLGIVILKLLGII